MNKNETFSIKWRPSKFSEVVGQKNVINSIINSFKLSKVYHSYLLSGPYGTGKTTIARLLAKGLNCNMKSNLNINYNFPCGKCEFCILMDNNKFIDFIEIDAASKTKVEDIRDLLNGLQYPPCQGLNKVYLIDEIHMLSKQSFSTLLKSLEEPPKNITFILVTTDIKKVPDTIISRCFKLNLNKISINSIVSKLNLISKNENINIKLNLLYVIADASNGSIRDSLNLLEQSYILSKNNITLEVINNLLGSCDLNILINLIELILSNNSIKLSKELYKISILNLDYEIILNKLITLTHYIFILNFHKDYIFDFFFIDKKLKIIELSKKNSLEKIKLIYNYFLKIKKNLEYYPNYRLAFEVYILQISYDLNKLT